MSSITKNDKKKADKKTAKTEKNTEEIAPKTDKKSKKTTEDKKKPEGSKKRTHSETVESTTPETTTTTEDITVYASSFPSDIQQDEIISAFKTITPKSVRLTFVKPGMKNAKRSGFISFHSDSDRIAALKEGLTIRNGKCPMVLPTPRTSVEISFSPAEKNATDADIKATVLSFLGSQATNVQFRRNITAYVSFKDVSSAPAAIKILKSVGGVKAKIGRVSRDAIGSVAPVASEEAIAAHKAAQAEIPAKKAKKSTN